MAANSIYFIQKHDFLDFIKGISGDFKVFYLKQIETKFNWKKGERRLLCWQECKDGFDGLTIAEVRAQDPLKQFVFSSKEKVSKDFVGLEDKEEKPVMLIGAKNCDLSGLAITDFVFMQGDCKDPFYIKKRQSMLIIASDCSNPIDTCFCLALDSSPYPQKNFDLSLSDIGDGYVVEVSGQRASDYVNKNKDKFVPATSVQIEKKFELRNATIKALESNIRKHEIPTKDSLAGIMDKGYDSNIWSEEIKTCVECGCCNTICPTCHCFFLSDARAGKENVRYKIWDACLYKDFAAVAGGANPRKRLHSRLRNRYDKKFNFFPNVAGLIACTGCGRCISGCPAKIDIRRILKNLFKLKIGL
jgi:ferredoxin